MAQDGPPLPPRVGFPIDSYKFLDTNWVSTFGYAPRSFYGIEAVPGIATNWAVRVANGTPAWLQYNYVESDGRTNLAFPGAMTLWVRPATWTSTNFEDGTGPGVPARLFEAGGYAGDGSCGLFSLHLNEEGSLLTLEAQSNAFGGTVLEAPVAWSNEWHMVGINYSTNFVELYVDGELAAYNTNGLGYWPNDALLSTNGLFWGSDFTGSNLAGADLCLMRTYDFPIAASSMNVQYWRVLTNYVPGGIGQATPPGGNNNTNQDLNGNNSVNTMDGATNTLTLSIIFDRTNLFLTVNGGTNGIPYDLFYTTNLIGTNVAQSSWAWLTNVSNGQTYTLSNQPSPIFFVLGTPQDSDGDGLTDAYERLVSKTNPYNADTDGDGLSDKWEILHGMNPNVDESAQTSGRLNYQYDGAGWLRVISGAWAESITLDPEGNVQQVP